MWPQGQVSSKQNKVRIKEFRLPLIEQQAPTDSLVVNLSNRVLTPWEEAILQLGTGFVPNPGYDTFRTRVDLFKLIRAINIFLKNGNVPNVINEWRPKSTFTPNASDPNITVFEQLVMKDINKLELQHKKPFYNFSLEDRKILMNLMNLMNDSSIEFKEADKGGAIVALNKQDYQNEIDKQLEDTQYYKIMERDPTKWIFSIIKITVQEGLLYGNNKWKFRNT